MRRAPRSRQLLGQQVSRNPFVLNLMPMQTLMLCWKNALILSQGLKTVTATPFIKSLGSMKKITIVSAAAATVRGGVSTYNPPSLVFQRNGQ